MIVDFFEGSEIFITGASGVVGKALIEKLLRSCNVKRIFILLRPKRNVAPEQRLEEIFKDKIFRRLCSEKKDELKKIVCIPGDVLQPQLGISSEDTERMANVSIVFHSAATVRFNEPLLSAIAMNVGGTFETLKFAEGLKNLKLFMHISTFYSNPYVECVEAKVYPSPLNWKVCLKLVEQKHNEEIIDYLTKRMLEGFPNTYTFTKNVAESMVNDFKGRLPVAIFRPSIVVCALKEPEPGFPTSFQGAVGVMALLACGIQKTIYTKPTAILDFTPLDMCTIGLTWYAAKAGSLYRSGIPESVPVYLLNSETYFSITFPALCKTYMPEVYKYPYVKSLLLPGVVCTSSRPLYMFLIFTKHLLPAMLVDAVLMALGKKPALMKVIRKVFIGLEVLKPFFFNNYRTLGITDFDEMLQSTRGTEFDMNEFYMAIPEDNFINKHQSDIVYKIRDVLLNEDPSSLPKARKILMAKRIAYMAMQLIFAIYLLKYTMNLLNCTIK